MVERRETQHLAMGQYTNYRYALEAQEAERILYLAIPSNITIQLGKSKMPTVNISIPFESLVATITSLSLEEQTQLLEILEERVFEGEEEFEDSPEVLAEVQAARESYKMGDYKTIEEYIANHSNQDS